MAVEGTSAHERRAPQIAMEAMESFLTNYSDPRVRLVLVAADAEERSQLSEVRRRAQRPPCPWRTRPAARATGVRPLARTRRRSPCAAHGQRGAAEGRGQALPVSAARHRRRTRATRGRRCIVCPTNWRFKAGACAAALEINKAAPDLEK
jgi:hypothetical protein